MVGAFFAALTSACGFAAPVPRQLYGPEKLRVATGQGHLDHGELCAVSERVSVVTGQVSGKQVVDANKYALQVTPTRRSGPKFGRQ